MTKKPDGKDPFDAFYASDDFQGVLKDKLSYQEIQDARMDRVAKVKQNIDKVNLAIAIEPESVEAEFDKESLAAAEYIADRLVHRLNVLFPIFPKEYILKLSIYAVLYVWTILEIFLHGEDDADGNGETPHDSASGD